MSKTISTTITVGSMIEEKMIFDYFGRDVELTVVPMVFPTGEVGYGLKETGIYPFSENKEDLVAFVEAYHEEILDYMEDDRNYGIGFFVAGYDGNAQIRFQKECESRGVLCF